MKLGRGRLLLFALLAVALFSTLAVGAVFGAVGRYSVRFPLNYFNQVADTAWGLYSKMKGGVPIAAPVGDDVTFTTMFTKLHARVFHIPIASRGGEGGAMTSVGNTLLLMAHDGRFFAGSSDTGFRKIDAITPPENGFKSYFDATHRPPYDSTIQNYANFRYNDIATFSTASSAGLLISYTYFDDARACYATRVSRFDFPNKDASLGDITIRADDWRVLFETGPCLPLSAEGRIYVQVAGGRLAVDNTKSTVFLASGTYEALNPNKGAALSQDPANDYGKVIAIDIATGTSQRLTSGHRNPQGITLDASGRIWLVEHGPRGGDELNRIVAGKNYGWPLAVYGTSYDQRPYPGVLNAGRHDGFEEPTLAWLPGIAPGTIITVRGFHPTWNGDLLVGTLRSQKLVHIRLVEDRVVFAEEIPIGRRVRHLHQPRDGSIALWNGKNELMILTPREPAGGAEIVKAIIKSLDAPPALKTAVQGELDKCMQCHSLERGDNTKAPSLAEAFESRVGSSNYTEYSAGMKNAGGVWSRERLKAFLRDPNSMVPGTAMPDPAIADEKLRAAVVEALIALKRTKAAPENY